MPKNLRMYSYFAFFAFGFYVVILSSAFPRVLSDLSINYLYGGYLFMLGTLGYVAGSALCAFFAHKVGLRFIARSGALLLAVGAFGYVVSDDFWKLVISGFVANFGTGLIEIGVGSLVGTFDAERSASMLNHVNSLFALGALIGPFVVSAFIRFSLGWRMVYLLEIAISMIAFFYSIKLEEPHFVLEERFDFKSAFKPKILLIDILIMIYVGYEVGFSAWISTFLVHVKGINIVWAAAISAVFWLGMFIGRYGASYVKVREEKWLLFVATSSLVCVISFMISSNFYLAVFFIFLSGASFASTYPTIQALLAKDEKGKIGNLMGIFVLFVGIGASLSDWIIGGISNRFGIFYGFMTNPVMIAIELTLTLVLLKSYYTRSVDNIVEK